MSSIYEGLVICHPKEHCSTWDFCTHYIPHVKGDACSCDSCVPCDIKTVLQHRVKMKEANFAARDKEWVEWLETNLIKEVDSGLDFRELPKFALKDWQERKLSLQSSAALTNLMDAFPDLTDDAKEYYQNGGRENEDR